MTPAATPSAASITQLALLGVAMVPALGCAIVSWWLLAPHTTAALQLGIGALVLAPASIATWALWRQALRHAAARNAAMRQSLASDEAQQALQRARRDRDLLVAALDTLPIGLAIFDPRDRRVLHNAALGQMIIGLDAQPRSGLRDLLDVEAAMGVTVEGTQARCDATLSGSAQLLQYPGDRWVQAIAAHSAEGLATVARVDVTELARAQHQAARANEQLALESATDGLTGITNRRHFDTVLHSEWSRAARANASIGLLIADIDHFKRYNDHYGHVAGDECLRQVARLLQSCVRRAGEFVARYGGEEFVILLPGADAAQAQDMAQRCLRGIERIALPHAASSTADHVTISIGIAQVHPGATGNPPDLVNAADTAMYRAKMAGRARFAMADQADWQIDKDAPRSTTAALE